MRTKLEQKLSKYTINDAINIEKSDLQFIALQKMYNKLEDRKLYLAFILVNALICYQLSSSGEKYWEEFSKKSIEYLNNSYFSAIASFSPQAVSLVTPSIEGDLRGSFGRYISNFFSEFLPNSKGNKRFVNIKLKRIEKILPFLNDFIGKEEFYYENTQLLRDNLAKYMNQKITAKTIVFAVKMFGYGARIYFDKIIYFPKEIVIPIDSRLTNLYNKYIIDYEEKVNIDKFYEILSEKTGISPLHLDSILWVNYNEFMENKSI